MMKQFVRLLSLLLLVLVAVPAAEASHKESVFVTIKGRDGHFRDFGHYSHFGHYYHNGHHHDCYHHDRYYVERVLKNSKCHIHEKKKKVKLFKIKLPWDPYKRKYDNHGHGHKH